MDLFRHFVQTAAQAFADALAEVIREVRGEDRRPRVVVARVDDVVEDIVHKERRLLRSELIEHQQIRLEKRPQDLRLARNFVGIEGGLNLLNEILEVAEDELPGLFPVDDGEQHRDCEMRLARPARSGQEQAFAILAARRPRIGELADIVLGANKGAAAARREGIERAVVIAPRDVRRRDALTPPRPLLTRARIDVVTAGSERHPAGTGAAGARKRDDGGHWPGSLAKAGTDERQTSNVKNLQL